MLKKKLLTILIFISCVSLVKAQKLYEQVSQDSLLFMVYVNANEQINRPLKEGLEEILPLRVQKLLKYSNEFCLSVSRHSFYDTYSIAINDVKADALNKVDSALQEMDFSVSSFEPGFITIQRQGVNSGFVRIHENQIYIELYALLQPVNPELRKAFNKIKVNDFDKYANYSFWEQRDSIMRLDSANAVQFIDGLIMQEKWSPFSEKVKNPIAWKSVLGESAHNSSVLAYLNPDVVNELPYHLYMLCNQDLYKFYKWIGTAQGVFSFYKKLWMGVECKGNTLTINSVIDSDTKKTFNKKLDKDVLAYLPDTVPNMLLTYHMDLSVLKYHLAKALYASDYDNEENGLIKLAALALDDEMLNALGNGFISIIEGDINGHHMPSLKVALRMPNPEKGKMLLEILLHDFKFLREVEPGCYRFVGREFRDEKELNLYIKDDIWVLGTGSLESVKQTLTAKQLQQLYPQLGNRSLSQFIDLKGEGSKALTHDLESVSAKTIIVNKHRTKSEIVIEMRSEEIYE